MSVHAHRARVRTGILAACVLFNAWVLSSAGCGVDAEVAVVRGSINETLGRPIWQFDSQLPLYQTALSTAIAYDSDRNVTVALITRPSGGNSFYSDTWERAQGVWTQVTTTRAPLVWIYGAMAYDPVRQRVVVFGTSDQHGLSLGTDETWTYDGSDWTLELPPLSPPARYGAALTYNPDDQRIYLFGGFDYQNGQFNDLWAWNGLTWTEAQAPNAARPPGFSSTVSFLAYDASRHRLVTESFIDINHVAMTGLWEFDGVEWSERVVMPGSPRSIIYDPDKRQIVATPYAQQNDQLCPTYTWDGLTLRSSGQDPCLAGQAAFDLQRHRVVAVDVSIRAIYEYHSRGEPCLAGSECHSGQCVDGVCCEQNLCGTCEACNTARDPGICALVTDSIDPDTCVAPYQCGPTGACGFGTGTSCALGEPCASGFCVDGYCCNAPCAGACGACNAADRGWVGTNGLCSAAPIGTVVAACMPFSCAGELDCPTACSSDGDCASEKYCAADGTCKVRRGVAEVCNATSDCRVAGCRVCSSGFCSDGVCCAQACTNACSSCNEAGSAGQCTARSDVESLPHDACSTHADCCASQRCIYGRCENGAAPVFETLATSTTATVRQAYHYNAAQGDRARAVGGSPIRYSIASTLPNIAIDPSSGKIFFVPTSAGVADITVTATNSWGATQQQFSVTVSSDGPPVIARDANLSAVVGRGYVLNATGAMTALGAQPISFSLREGPEGFRISSATGRVDWRPAQAMPAQIVVAATNAEGTDTYSFTVDVAASAAQPDPTARITTNPSPPVRDAPFLLSFDSSTSTAADGAMIVGRFWTFGDGTPPSTEIAPSHTYQSAGSYVARLLVLDNLSASNTASIGVQASTGGQTAPLARIAATPQVGPAPLAVAFSCDCSADVRAMKWTFGDGEESSAISGMHFYARPGTYPLRLEAIASDESVLARDQLQIEVRDGERLPPRVVGFASVTTGPAPLTVILGGIVGDLDGTVEQTFWRLGQTRIAEGTDARYVFQEPGVYALELHAIDNDGIEGSSVVEVQVTRQGAMPPAILSVARKVAQVGVPYRLSDDGNAVARGSLPLRWSLGKRVDGAMQNMPSGMDVDPNTGIVTWTPSAKQVGANPVTLNVTNDASSASQDFVVVVEPALGAQGCGCDVGARAQGDPRVAVPFALAGLFLLALRRARRRA